jgi:hypothetical protein
MPEPEQQWIRCKWKAEELDGHRIEFRFLPLKTGETVGGFGVIGAISRPPVDDLLSIEIVVEELAGVAKVRQTGFQIPQQLADRIELHPNQEVARFRLLSE